MLHLHDGKWGGTRLTACAFVQTTKWRRGYRKGLTMPLFVAVLLQELLHPASSLGPSESADGRAGFAQDYAAIH